MSQLTKESNRERMRLLKEQMDKRRLQQTPYIMKSPPLYEEKVKDYPDLSLYEKLQIQ
jgi:hypothetical protein